VNPSFLTENYHISKFWVQNWVRPIENGFIDTRGNALKSFTPKTLAPGDVEEISLKLKFRKPGFYTLVANLTFGAENDRKTVPNTHKMVEIEDRKGDKKRYFWL